MRSEKSITEAEIVRALERGEVQLGPLAFEVLPGGEEGPAVPDAWVRVRWGGRAYRFGVECRRLWTPRAVTEAADAALRVVRGSDSYPLVLVPYLSEERLAELERQGVSGVDLCGNGVVAVPGEMLVWRSGSPNCFRWEKTIKNVYRKDSSLAARVFLLVPRFGSVREAQQEIERRGGQLTLGTVSKVCQALEEDLVIERSAGAARRLRLLQPDKLLDLLAENYVPPEVKRRYVGKCRLGPDELRGRLVSWEEGGGGRVVRTGGSSVEAYAVMAREPVQSFYCTDVGSLVAALGDSIREGDRFANVELVQTDDLRVYFDRRPGLVASPIQTYLELAGGEKRERQTAEQVRRAILEPLGQAMKEASEGPTAGEPAWPVP